MQLIKVLMGMGLFNNFFKTKEIDEQVDLTTIIFNT